MNENIEAIIFDWIGTLYHFDKKELFPYSKEVLSKLQPEYKLAVISKAVSDSIENRKKQIYEIGNFFDVIIVDFDKTETHYKACMAKLGVSPKNTIIVDDRIDRGIQIGNVLGCQTYWINNGKYSHILPNEKTGQPTKIINSVEDLLKIL